MQTSARKLWIVHLLVAVAAMTMLGGCSSSTSNDEAAIRSILEKHQQWYNAGDWKSISSEFADDVLVMPDFAPTVVSKDSVTVLFKDIFSGLAQAGATQTMNAHLDEVRVFGDWAFDRGAFEITTRKGDKSRVFNIRFLEIFHKHADGTWKIMRGINNYTEAPFPPTPSK